MSEWISVKDRLPEEEETVLALAKKGNYWPDVHGPKDHRSLEMYVGYFFDDHKNFKNLKPNSKFEVDCGCSGYEYDKADLEVIFWRPLPEPPVVEY